jgi:hypothetical protein
MGFMKEVKKCIGAINDGWSPEFPTCSGRCFVNSMIKFFSAIPAKAGIREAVLKFHFSTPERHARLTNIISRSQKFADLFSGGCFIRITV